MQQIIAISQVTMKRLLNYQRLTEKEENAANRCQWIEMTLENMHRAEAARKKAAHIEAIVAYAGFLFRVQNRITAYRSLYGEVLLHNGLVQLMNTLMISVDMVAVDNEETDAETQSQLPPPEAVRAPLHLVATGSTGNSRCRR